MLQNTMRALPGSRSGGRSTMAEKSQRSRGSMGSVIYYLRGRNAHDTGGRRNDPAASWPFACQRLARHRVPAPAGLEDSHDGGGRYDGIATEVFTYWASDVWTI